MISHFRHLRTYFGKIFTNRRQLCAFTSSISIQRNVSYEEVRKSSSDHSKENLLSVANLSHLTSQICALRSFSTSSRLFESQQSDSETKNHIRHLEITRSPKNEKMIIVQNLSEEIPQDVIQEYFSRFGDVDTCVTFHVDGCLIGHVGFKSPNSVNNVLNCGPHYAIGDRITNEIETKASKSMTLTKEADLEEIQSNLDKPTPSITRQFCPVPAKI
ncbi:hypothetical protein Ddc_15690 [Ditylenchus destructor]|nr:hypothetical protein Ddc_15690 [Ditylenchus destructor]